MNKSLWILLASLFVGMPTLSAGEVADWQPYPKGWNGATFVQKRATLTADKWSYLVAPDKITNGELSARVTILQPAKRFNFFGEGWSAWPDPTFGDGGFEAGLLLRSGTVSIPFNGQTITREVGYRVQLSHKYQAAALVKFPDGGYVRVVPCPVKLETPHTIQARVAGNEIVVAIDGGEKIRYRDDFLSIASGQFGVGVSSSAKVEFSDLAVKPLPAPTPTAAAKHTPKFSVRKFLGGRQWIFDGDEPILQLHHEGDPSCFAKLRPGYKPQLTFDSHWGLENQGAFNEAASKWTAPAVTGGGDSIEAKWSARHVKDRFVTRSTLTVGYDLRRGTYTYAVDSELEVLPGEPFHFRYGFDFEHHTPLDPFGWQYLIGKTKGGTLFHRPVTPVDPGPQNDLEGYHGLRAWHGRHVDTLQVAPAVEYEMDPAWNEVTREGGKKSSRKLNTAVCAAFYDTGISFEPETTPPGSKVRVKYRYTGYPASETRELFEQSKIYESPTLDPNHHYIFADEWPKLTFSKFVPLSESWIYGRTPFMTGHNQRPTYELVKNCGAGSGFAMRLGPASFAKANLPAAPSLTKGRWMMTALVKAQNIHGPGGRIELDVTQAKTGKSLMSARHFIGNGTFDWRKQGFVFEVPDGAAGLSIGFGNSGTGDMLVTDVEFSPLKGEPPAGILDRPNDRPAEIPAAPAGAVADYRMLEGKGHFVLNHAAAGPLGHLNLANLDWVTDQGRPALRFADNLTGRKDYRADTALGRGYFGHPAYEDKQTLPVAIAGHHGGGEKLTGLTLAVWIKPAAEMGKSHHGGKGDILGYGARRFILGLHNQKAPYQLAARLNVNDTIVSDAKLEADRWQHVAMTCEPAGGQWNVRLYLDGKQVGEGTTKKFASDAVVPPSLILGAEIFYLHDAYYRGLIGRTLVCHRVLTEREIGELAK